MLRYLAVLLLLVGCEAAKPAPKPAPRRMEPPMPHYQLTPILPPPTVPPYRSRPYLPPNERRLNDFYNATPPQRAVDQTFGEAERQRMIQRHKLGCN